MDAQLVGATGYRLQRDPGREAGGIVGQRAVASQRGSAAFAVDDLARPVWPVRGERQIDFAVGRRRAPADDCHIPLADGALRERAAQSL
jgi:hypothetical protein